MRVVIRDGKTGSYFRWPDLWVKSRSEAEKFESAVRAIMVVIQRKWTGVEVMLELDGEPFECRLWKSG